jgi:hypothetical protein
MVRMEEWSAIGFPFLQRCSILLSATRWDPRRERSNVSPKRCSSLIISACDETSPNSSRTQEPAHPCWSRADGTANPAMPRQESRSASGKRTSLRCRPEK